MSADPAAGNRPHTRPEFDQIRFNCAADRSPNVLEMHVPDCAWAYARVRAYMWGSESRVTRYDVVSRDNAGMLRGMKERARDRMVYEEQTRSAVSHDEVE